MVYDMTLKFESELFVKTFDKNFELLLSNLGNPINNFGKTVKLEHTMNISNSPVLPNNEFIETLKNNIFESLIETFSEQDSLNIEVKRVNFIGITQIQQKEEG